MFKEEFDYGLCTYKLKHAATTESFTCECSAGDEGRRAFLSGGTFNLIYDLSSGVLPEALREGGYVCVLALQRNLHTASFATSLEKAWPNRF